MLVTLGDDKKIASFVSNKDIEKFESLGIKMYNYLNDGTTLLWFDGQKWLFPKPIDNIQQSSNNEMTDLLKKISNQLDEIIGSTNE